MKNNQIKIIYDIEAFQERVDEIEASTTYDHVTHVISELKQALYQNNDTAAVCAPQVGYPLRLFVVKQAKSERDRFKVFLNPMLISSEGLHLSRETNLSFPDKQYIIPRRNKIHVAYQKANGEPSSETYSGAYAEVIQQMIEMLDGITLTDYGLDLDDVGGPSAFDKATKKDKAQVIQMYLESLRDTYGDLKNEIDSSESLSYLDKLIDFRSKMLTGEIKPIDNEGNIIDDEFIKKKAKEKVNDILAKAEKK